MRSMAVSSVKHHLADHPDWARGAARIFSADGGTAFERMSSALLEFWKAPEGKRLRARSTAGVRLVLRTDARRIALALHFAGTARPYHGLDLAVDGGEPRRIGPPDGRPQSWSEEIFTQASRRVRTLEIWLPHASEVILDALEAEEGALLEAAPPLEKTWVAIGDSITQGMLASSPARVYAAVAARAMRWELRNLAVGGETMQEALGRLCRPLGGDLATVAFGVNDYNQGMPIAEFARRARALLDGLLEGRPAFPVVLLTPFPWVGASAPANAAAPLEEYRATLRALAPSYPSVRVLEGPALLPSDPALFADHVHPNDAGMKCLGERLARELPRLLREIH